MKKLVAVWDGLCWLLSILMPSFMHRVVPHPYSIAVCVAVLLFNIAYMVWGRRLRETKTKRSQLAIVFETILYVLAPIGGIIIAILYEVYDKNPLII